MATKLTTQVRELSPSAREPLFRRLMVEESLSYLRDNNSIIGFEVDMSADQTLSGFALIAIQKHTTYAFVSDLNEKPRLILFPPLDKLFDPAFELLGLMVVKKKFTSSDFKGTMVERGLMEDLVRDLTPPVKEVDIPKQVAEQMAKRIQEAGKNPPAEKPKAPDPKPELETAEPEVPEDDGFFVEEPGEPPMEMDLNAGFDDGGFDDNNFDDYNESFDEYGGYESGFDDSGFDDGGFDMAEPEPEPEPVGDPRTVKLKAQTFQSLSEVSDFCSNVLGVQRALAVNVVNKALQSNVAPEYRIDLAIKLFAKLFDEKKI